MLKIIIHKTKFLKSNNQNIRVVIYLESNIQAEGKMTKDNTSNNLNTYLYQFHKCKLSVV